jgi:hypothetical protein
MSRIISGPNQAFLERISYLEAQLAAYTGTPKSEPGQVYGIHNDSQHAFSSPSSEEELQRGSIGDIVGFLSLGGEPA